MPKGCTLFCQLVNRLNTQCHHEARLFWCRKQHFAAKKGQSEAFLGKNHITYDVLAISEFNRMISVVFSSSNWHDEFHGNAKNGGKIQFLVLSMAHATEQSQSTKHHDGNY